MDRAGVVRAGVALGDHFQNVDLIDELVVLEGEAGQAVAVLLDGRVVEVDEVVVLKVRIEGNAKHATLTTTAVFINRLDRAALMVGG